MGVSQDLWEQEDINLQSWRGFGAETWKPGLSVAGGCIASFLFSVTGAEQRLFWVQAGVVGKAKQSSRQL